MKSSTVKLRKSQKKNYTWQNEHSLDSLACAVRFGFGNNI